jgi:hypothetical protein
MKQILFGFLCSGLLFGTILTANAQTRSLSQDELMYQINTLLAQIASLQAIIDERERGITISGEPSISLTQPTPYMTVPDGISFTVAWEAENIPPNSMLLLDTKAALLYGGSGISGGTYRQAMNPGDSEGVRVMKTGVGHQDPGTYDVRALVVRCVDLLCTQSAVTYDSLTGDRIYLSEILAESEWVRYTISETAESNFSGDGTITIGSISPSDGSIRLGEAMKVSFYLFGDVGADQEVCFYLRSSTGKTFSPRSNTYDQCAPAKVGYNERTWTPYRTSGFNLDPGLYKFQIRVMNPPNSSGKDVGYAAEADGNWVELLPEA